MKTSRLFVLTCISFGVLVLSSCTSDKPSKNYTTEQAIGVKEFPVYNIKILDQAEAEADKRNVTLSFDEQDSILNVFKASLPKVQEKIVDINLGEFKDIDGFHEVIQKYFDNQYFGAISYIVHSITLDNKEVTSIAMQKIPLLGSDGESIRKEGESGRYSDYTIDLENNPGWEYLYKINSFSYIENSHWLLSSWHPYIHKVLKVDLTPCAREALVIVMKMLRGETLSPSEQEIAKKYESQVKPYINK